RDLLSSLHDALPISSGSKTALHQPHYAMNGLECSSTDLGLSQKRGDSPLYSKVRLASLFLSNTPLHPQWFSFRAKEQARKSAVRSEEHTSELQSREK